MRKVFCGSMCDILDTDSASIEQMNSERYRLWNTIRYTENLIWQLLTKRPNMYQRFLPGDLLAHPRVWKGISTEDQKTYDERSPYMRAMAGMWWISYEPALGPLDIDPYESNDADLYLPCWVICGGESGTGFREMKPAWARALKYQCEKFCVPFFMKQMSGRTPAIGKSFIPADLLSGQFPSLA